MLWNVPVINESNRIWKNLSIAASKATGCNISRCNLEPQIDLKKILNRPAASSNPPSVTVGEDGIPNANER